ncbi:symporter YjcG [Rhodococcus sp. B7740]|uniref:solute symporter family protein n=1 Tax=Rhodococcus sp. B7740 TaxID=1564114 RepID=UPI0005DA1018|nr:cation acetate symporter [Rhodococcus sp. B7740]AJW40288.1 symporter YjcG [Rhodococcus sp. B7740]
MNDSGMSLAVVAGIVLATLGLAAYAARRNSGTGDHYVAGQRVSGFQNGLALAGEQLSAASLLGITGAVALTGFSGFYLAIGIPTAFLLVLLVVAEPLRNLGKYTLADVVSFRFEGRLLRGSIAVTTLLISTIYMMIQFVGAGVLAELLLDVPFSVAVVVLAVLMTIYMLLGGMVAATYIQVFKSMLLLILVFVLLLFVISRTGWNPLGPLAQAADSFGIQTVSSHRLDGVSAWNNVSLMIGLSLGVMGLPHVMLRFLTTKNAKAARTSALIAMIIFSFFFLVLPIFGYAALNTVGRDTIVADNKGGNLAVARLAEAVGGNVLLAVLAGVVIATILAVLAGIAIAASGAAAHDLYTNVIKRGDVTPERQLLVGRVAGVAISIIAILLALGAQNLNIGFLANVAFALAASTLTPVLVLTIYWRGFNRVGAQAAITGGLLSSVVLVIIGPNVMGDSALFPLSIPAIVTVPLAFLLALGGSVVGRSRTGARGRDYGEILSKAFPTRAVGTLDGTASAVGNS